MDGLWGMVNILRIVEVFYLYEIVDLMFKGKCTMLCMLNG